MSDKQMEDLGVLPQGNHLYRKRNEAGGWTYYSDECGCMSMVWDTCIANESTLLTAILCEQHRRHMEFMHNQGWKPDKDMQIEHMAATGGSFLGPIENGAVDSPFIAGSGILLDRDHVELKDLIEQPDEVRGDDRTARRGGSHV